jgi:hypothetical protein
LDLFFARITLLIEFVFVLSFSKRLSRIKKELQSRQTIRALIIFIYY